MAGAAALVVPSINKMAARAAHLKRIHDTLKSISKNRAESFDTGVAIIDGLWYTPFDVEPHTIDVDGEKIVVESFYLIRKLR